MEFFPANHNILCEKNTETKDITSDSGLILLQEAASIESFKVISFDNNNKLSCNVKVGDEVFFNHKAAIPVELDGKNYYLIKDELIFGIFRERQRSLKNEQS